MAGKSSPRKQAYPSSAIPVLTPIHLTLLEPWDKPRIQQLCVVLSSDREVYVGHDEELEMELSETDRVINACPSLLVLSRAQHTGTLLVPHAYDRKTLAAIEDEENRSEDSFWRNPPLGEETESTLESTETSPETIEGKSPFDIIADFNRKPSTNKLDHFNRPRIEPKSRPMPTLSKPEFTLTLPPAEALLKPLSELRTQRIAEQRRLARLELLLDDKNKGSPEFSQLPTDH